MLHQAQFTSLPAIRQQLQLIADTQTAAVLQRFFKTGVGEYGEGDVFIGIKVPPLRTLAAACQNASVKTVTGLLKSNIHEERTLALMILVRQFSRGDEKTRKQIYDVYLAHTRFINNWDLVDGSAPYIIGPFLWERERTQLYTWAKSSSLWERRIAIISTFYFIRQNDFSDALRISEVLITDKQDLIHKAVGWMLREIGKRNTAVEESFLKVHYRDMPRTMLRYSIERFPEKRRREYLLGKI